jgi:ammonia channel protein AmtB
MNFKISFTIITGMPNLGLVLPTMKFSVEQTPSPLAAVVYCPIAHMVWAGGTGSKWLPRERPTGGLVRRGVVSRRLLPPSSWASAKDCHD